MTHEPTLSSSETMETNTIDADDVKTMFEAAKDGDAAQLRALLQAGVPADVTDRNSRVPLFVAAGVGHVECIEALLDAGARINRRIRPGTQNMAHSALDNALLQKHVPAARLLLERGADPRLLDHKEQTAGHVILARIRPPDAAGVRDDPVLWEGLLALALKSRQPVNQVDKDGQTLLHIAVHGSKPLSTIGLLLAHGADPDVANFEGRKAVHREWDTRTVGMLNLLAEKGVDLDARDYRGRTALFFAMDEEAARAILTQGSDINAVNDVGQNVLAGRLESGRSIRQSEVDMFTYLLTQGLDVEARDYAGDSAIDILKTRTDGTAKTLLGAIMAFKARQTMRDHIGMVRPSSSPT